MKNRTIVKRFTWVLAICFISAMVLSACRNTDEHPKGEHPQEHPATNAPARNP